MKKFFAILTLITAAILPLFQIHVVFAASKMTCASPPSNVDHASLTNAQLELYGLPPRTSDESLEHWQQVVRNAKHHVCQSEVPNNRSNVTTHSPQLQKISPKLTSGNYTDPAWDGFIATGFGYTKVVGQWNVPCLTLKHITGYSAVWVGLGGIQQQGSTNLVQSGSEQDELYSSGTWHSQYYAWIEDYPDDRTQLYAFGVNCADTMYAIDWQDYSGSTPIKAHMYISDWSSGKYWSAWNTQSFTNGSTAEWIVERPTVNNGYSSVQIG